MADILHLRPQWQKLAARLQHEARKTCGYGIITVRVIVVDGNGNPVLWTEPSLTKLEPKGLADPGVLAEVFGVDGSSEI